MKRLFFVYIITTFFYTSPSFAQDNKTESIKYLKSNMEFLASDELEGREAGSHGERVSSLFIAKELEKYGAKPFGDNGTYFQNFDLYVKEVRDNSQIKFTSPDGNELHFGYKKDFYFSSRPAFPDNEFTNKAYEIVFAGYGLKSEEDNYNDYSNLNVKGKTVLILAGTPLESQKHLRSLTLRKLKSKYAKEEGASGVLVVTNSIIISYWPILGRYLTLPSFQLEMEANEEPKEIPTTILSEEAIKKILEGEKYSYEELINFEKENKAPESFVLNKQITFNYTTEQKIKKARNVIGIIEGHDPNLKNEYVTIGGHYDHLGIRGDNIYNGADDNGSGIVSILELARNFAEERDNKRSILFIFHTAEEKGLKGAKYLTNTVDYVDDMVVNINIDMIGRESIDTIYVVGSGRLSTELYELVKEANKESVNFELDYKFDDPKDPQDLYNRSDHVHYAEKRIPVVFFFDKMEVDYHKPTDTFEKINYDKIYKVNELVKELTLKIANRKHKLKVDKLTTK